MPALTPTFLHFARVLVFRRKRKTTLDGLKSRSDARSAEHCASGHMGHRGNINRLVVAGVLATYR